MAKEKADRGRDDDDSAPAEHVHGPHCAHDHAHVHEAASPFRRSEPRIGRNDPCFCGSGKKFKKCHGAAGG